MNNFYVYVHYRNDTLQPFYVGKGTGKRYKSNRRNTYWKNIVNKVGYTPMIIENFLTEEESFELEKYYIQHFGRNNLCNMTDGGEGVSGVIRTKETRKKIGESHKGKKHTQESKKKISEINKGKKFTEEHKKNISQSNKCGRNPKSKKVINIETNKIYFCVREAAEAINITYDKMRERLQGKTKNKTPFKYYE
jgi:hypothetical protein